MQIGHSLKISLKKNVIFSILVTTAPANAVHDNLYFNYFIRMMGPACHKFKSESKLEGGCRQVSVGFIDKLNEQVGIRQVEHNVKKMWRKIPRKSKNTEYILKGLESYGCPCTHIIPN